MSPTKTINDDDDNKDSKRTRCEVYSRIVGYLRPVSQWNDGKTAEFSKRKTYKIKNS